MDNKYGIEKPMNPYAETYFDQAVDNALDELARKAKSSAESVVDAIREETKKIAESFDAKKLVEDDALFQLSDDEMQKLRDGIKTAPMYEEPKDKDPNSITLPFDAVDEWLPMMRTLTKNGYHFGVYPYRALGEVLIEWGDKE